VNRIKLTFLIYLKVKVVFVFDIEFFYILDFVLFFNVCVSSKYLFALEFVFRAYLTVGYTSD